MKKSGEHILHKIKSLDEIQSLLDTWKAKKEPIVFTNGCFDIIHKGHIDYLSKAADFGNLIVAVNTDNSVKKLGKGINRPIQDESSRALIMAAFEFVKAVILFDEETPYQIIQIIQPDVLVKGADYKIEEIVGHDIVLNNGGRVETIDIVPGYSTSSIEARIKKS